MVSVGVVIVISFVVVFVGVVGVVDVVVVGIVRVVVIEDVIEVEEGAVGDKVLLYPQLTFSE